ncbi:MAG: exodeoxyribonuclease VII large subunit, partial [Acidobacteriota bacterium]
PSSGHYYFTLKDEASQIKAVFFKSQNRHLRFLPEAGLQVLCQARLSVYEPRGEYQLIVEMMEPQGIGALQLAFEQLKKKLEAEGLFDPARKLPLPLCPCRVGVVTSPTGAAIRDILSVLRRSPYPIVTTVLPVRVQGMEAGGEIARAVDLANRLVEKFDWDLLIVGRGGGSIEDLQPFNEEAVARAISDSRIPVISAVGHEIDYTISDLVADRRAPTPTAAAEWVVGQMEWFQRELTGYLSSMANTIGYRIEAYTQRLRSVEQRLIDPRKRLADTRSLVEERSARLRLALSRYFENLRTRETHLMKRLDLASPERMIRDHAKTLEATRRELELQYRKVLDVHRCRVQESTAKLDALSPLGALARGYSIAYRMPDRKIIRDVRDVQLGQDVLVQLSKGRIECVVREKSLVNPD